VLKRKLQAGNRNGFTLIELVVVIAILGILAGIAIPRFMDSQASAKGAKIVADLRTIDSAATIYYAQKGQYPTAITGNNPDTADGFVGKYLAAWPVPDTGTFIVSLLKGGSKTYTGITADCYTLTADGRANYNGHPVEWYLKGSDSDSLTLFASTREKAIAQVKAAKERIADGSTMNKAMTLIAGADNLKVESSLLTSVFGASAANTNLRWYANTLDDKGNVYYFANNPNSGDHGQWFGSLLVYNGKLYKSDKTINAQMNGSTPAEKVANIEAKGWKEVGDFSI
jgi:prepilin-type N-terminal cleavage/methylation domain-containing protein